MREMVQADGTPPVARNIEEIARFEENRVCRRTFAEKVADRVAGAAGTLAFVLLHAAGVVRLAMAASARANTPGVMP